MNFFVALALQVGLFLIFRSRIASFLTAVARLLSGGRWPREHRFPPVYIPFREASPSDTLVVDTSHAGRGFDTITHHKGGSANPTPLALLGDSSSDAVLTAIEMRHPLATAHPKVTTDHFDIDSFVSVWSLANPEAAIAYGPLLRAVARIGDFREHAPAEPIYEKALQARGGRGILGIT